MGDLVPVLLSKVETIVNRGLMCGSSMLPSIDEVCAELKHGGVEIDSGVIDGIGKVLAGYQERLGKEYQAMQNDSSRMLRVRDFKRIKEELWGEYQKLKDIGSIEKDDVHNRVMILKAISSVLEVEGKALGDIKGDNGTKFQAYINQNTFNLDKDNRISLDKLFKDLDEDTRRKVVIATTKQIGNEEIIDVQSEVIEDGDK